MLLLYRQHHLKYRGQQIFLKAVENKNSVKVFDIIDELMDVIKVTNGRLYNSVMRKIDEIEQKTGLIFSALNFWFHNFTIFIPATCSMSIPRLSNA